MGSPYLQPKQHDVTRLLQWYDRSRRDLPWRRSRDPYSVWISEIMLQQTTVKAAIPFFLRWMEVYPRVQNLAAASDDEVLLLWEGLGYYARARNLLRSARIIVERGGMPRTYSELLSLPGIGDYTARAIMSICFAEPLPALDANVRRIGQRLNAWTVWDGSLSRTLLSHLTEMIPPGRAGDFNEAFMELGQSVCRRIRPLCPDCPLGACCRALAEGTQGDIPRKKSRESITTESRLALPVRRRNRSSPWETWIVRREAGVLRGMWVFPAEGQSGFSEAGGRVPMGSLPRRVHGYTRFRERLIPKVYRVPAGFLPAEETPRGEWIELPLLGSRPMPSVYRRIAEDLEKLLRQNDGS